MDYKLKVEHVTRAGDIINIPEGAIGVQITNVAPWTITYLSPHFEGGVRRGPLGPGK